MHGHGGEMQDGNPAAAGGDERDPIRDASDARLAGQPPRAKRRPAEGHGPPGVVEPAPEPRRRPQAREAPVHQHAGDAHRRLLEAWGATADAADTSCISVTSPSDGRRPGSTPPSPRRQGTSCSRQATTRSSATARPGGVRCPRRCTRRRSSTASRAAADARAAGNDSRRMRRHPRRRAATCWA